MSKKCTQCGEIKPESEFHKNNKSPDGLNKNCKSCRKILERERQKKRTIIPVSEKECSRCHHIKPVSEFYKDRTSKTGHDSFCKSCKIEYREERKAAPVTVFITHKVCNKCGEEKPVRMFFEDKISKDGYNSSCKQCSHGILPPIVCDICHEEKKSTAFRPGDITCCECSNALFSERKKLISVLKEYVEKNTFEKQCTKCGLFKNLDYFANDSNGRYGRKSTCKKCQAEKDLITEVRITEHPAQKKCRECGEYHFIFMFAKSNRSKDGHSNLCKDCAKKYYKKRKRRKSVLPESGMKMCPTFQIMKPINQFSPKKDTKDGLHSSCRKCRIMGTREYEKKNPEKVKNTIKKWRMENPTYSKEKRANDPNYRLACNLRGRINIVLKGKSKSAKTMELIGCSIEELWEHLESQFSYGMTRENYGKWHVDHIKPCAAFDLTIPSEQRECFNWRNLQPMWASDNSIKGAKYNGIDYRTGNVVAE